MSLLQMSYSGAVMIGVVIVIRALTINRLPKRTFLILWGIVLLRLMVPFSIPSAFSVYSLIERNIALDALIPVPAEQVLFAESDGEPDADYPDVSHTAQNGNTINASYEETREIAPRVQRADGKAETILPGFDSEAYKTGSNVTHAGGYRSEKKINRGVIKLVCVVIWCAGMLCCISYFAGSYLRCRFEFQISLPVENAFVQSWLREHSRRPVSVRQSDRVSTPLTYGIFHPVILMPKSTDWENTKQLQYVLMHEYVHVCRYDALAKLIVTCALGIHWFNPMVWTMWFLFNRDVEISCDERVVRHMGEASKSAYARMLIQMEAERNGLAPLCSGLLSKNAMEERITAIMKIKKKSMPAVIVAAVLVISVATAFATSAAETRNKIADRTDGKTTEEGNHQTVPDTDFTEQEREMLLALKIDGYEDMSISAYREKVWTLTDTEEYNRVIERFFHDEAFYETYEPGEGNEIADFMYNVLGPVLSNQQSICIGGYAETTIPGAAENATLEYSGKLTILDADQLTVGEYLSVQRFIEEDMENIFQDLSVSELRDEELMKALIDETILNVTMTYQSNILWVEVEDYQYNVPYDVPVDDMEEWQKERRDEWDRMMEPYVPFGLTYNYDWDTDDYKMYFNGKEVRAIYDSVQSLWISEHSGTGEGIYDENAVDLYVVYEGRKIVGLREATAQEMAEADRKRFAVTEAYKSGQEEERRWTWELREEVPATEEDYQSLLALKTPDYRLKSIADFDRELLDWANENFERMERIGYDNMLEDYHVALTDEEKAFAAVTAHYSRMENAAYVRSLNKNEPEQAAGDSVRLYARQEDEVWCSLFYTFSYYISDKENVSVGERDDCVGGMTDSIRSYWESTDIDTLMAMSESDMLEFLHTVAAKYSSQSITITIVDDQTAFERMNERN